MQFRNFGEQLAESTYAPTDLELIQKNNEALASLLKGKIMTERGLTAEVRGAVRTLSAVTTQFSTGELLKFLKTYAWYDPRSREASQPNPLQLQIEFLEGKAGNHQIVDWLLLSPRIRDPRGKHQIGDTLFDVVYRSRHDQPPYRFNTYNDPGHRAYARYISSQIELTQVGEELESLRNPHRGVLMYYPVTEEEEGPVNEPYTVALTILFPPNNIRSQLGFTVRKRGQPDDAIVTVGD